MVRASLIGTLLLVLSGSLLGQSTGALRVKVALTDAQQRTVPVPRYALLISDDPPSAPPRRVLTGADGSFEIRLKPGRYTIESDRPFAFGGKRYSWVRNAEVPAGGEALLELSADNADVEAPADANADGAAHPANDPSLLLPTWQQSVVAIWSPLARGSGFAAGAPGWFVTSQRLIGAATTAEVQLSPTVKLLANVIAADATRNVAVLSVAPESVASLRPLPLSCDGPPAAVADGQDLHALGIPLRESATMTDGAVSRPDSRRIGTTLMLDRGTPGGPVFSADGRVVGLAVSAENEDRASVRAQVVSIGEICGVVAAAQRSAAAGKAPARVQLPVEPVIPLNTDALKEAVARRAGTLGPYQVSSPGFDVAFITPLTIYGAQYQESQVRPQQGRGGMRVVAEAMPQRPYLDFRNWSEYVADLPPVLLVRVTPKLTEGFWTKVARGAAATQGVAVPPIQRYAGGFDRLSAFCGDAEVVPIHPFKIEQRISETEAINEGLYVFDPGAFGPHCGSMKLVMYVDKTPEKGETRAIDGPIVQQIWEDFAPYRAASAAR